MSVSQVSNTPPQHHVQNPEPVKQAHERPDVPPAKKKHAADTHPHPAKKKHAVDIKV
jgi:hypothetical protein